MLGIRNVELGVLARYEVAGCEGVACATRAAIVPVRTDIDEEIATFAKQAVPQPTHLRGIDATESIGTAADRASSVGTRAAGDRALGHMTRRFDAEGDGRARIVEVAEMLDVVTVAAGGIEYARPFGVGRDSIGLQRIMRLQPRYARHRFLMTRRAAIVDVVLARPNLTIFTIQQADRVGIGAVKAEFVLGHLVGVAVSARILSGDHRDVGMLVAWNDPFQPFDEHLVVYRRAVDNDRIFNFLDRLPAPHGGAAAGTVRRALQAGDRDAVDGPAERLTPGGRRIARQVGAIVAEAAVAVARTAMVAKGEPIEIKIGAAASGDTSGDRTVDRVASRNRTVGAGIVIMHVASDIRVGSGFISAPIVGRGGVRQSQRDRSSRQQNCFSRWKHLIAPLAISDARQLKNENTSRCAVREFLYGSQKIRTRRQFGEGFILERTVLKKNSGIRLSPFLFFS